MNKNIGEKRNIPRLLCDNNFGEYTVSIDGNVFLAKAINFNHKGLALYTDNPLPDIDFARISFTYHNENEDISIVDLPARFIHAKESDDGWQYGISFQLGNDNVAVTQLKRIEAIIESYVDDE